MEEDIDRNQAQNDEEKESLFLELARFSEQSIKNEIDTRQDFSMCYQGFGAKIIPVKHNLSMWTIEFDNGI